MRDVLWLRAFRPVLATVALLAGAASAAAQNLPEANTWSVTPFLHTTLDVSGPDTANSPGLGVAVSYDWTRNLAFEGDTSYFFDIAGDNADVDWSISTLTANALYHFDTKYVTPYVAFGLGIEWSAFDVKNPDVLALYPDRSATEFAFNFGGGVKYALNDRWNARADLRRVQANDIAPDHWRLYGGVSFKVK